MHTNRLKALGISAFALSLATFGGQAAADVLPVQNLTFNQLTNPFNPANSQKDFFNSVQPLDWLVGTAGAGGSLTSVGQQGSEGFQGGSGNVYPVYTNPGFSVTVPAGTNFFQADGNPDFENTIFQTICCGPDGGHDIHPRVPAGSRSTGRVHRRHHRAVEGVPWRGRYRRRLLSMPAAPLPARLIISRHDSTLMNTPSEHEQDDNSGMLSP